MCRPRSSLALDMNGDGSFTGRDVLAWASHILLYPGDTAVVFLLSFKSLSHPLGLSPQVCGTWVSWLLSVAFWYALYRVYKWFRLL